MPPSDQEKVSLASADGVGDEVAALVEALVSVCVCGLKGVG